MITQDQAVVTTTDRHRLREMIESLRATLPINGQPYRAYLANLEARLNQMAAVSQDEVDADVVTMNSRVRVRDESDRDQVLTLVYDGDADVFGDKLSVVSPLGAEVFGSRVGDEVKWQTRRGERRLRIEEILFQPEAAGKFDL
jgi:regulator of nucleoside diphosphate kinase